MTSRRSFDASVRTRDHRCHRSSPLAQATVVSFSVVATWAASGPPAGELSTFREPHGPTLHSHHPERWDLSHNRGDCVSGPSSTGVSLIPLLSG